LRRIHRRTFLASGVAAFAATGLASAQAPNAARSLDRIASSKGLYFGTAVRMEELASEPDLSAAVLSQCSRLTPELALKWASIEPQRGQLNFAGADDLCGFALQNGKKVRGHTLLWHDSVPDWAPPLLREPGGWLIVSRYFGSIIPRFGDIVTTWDVVNEPIEIAHGRPDGLRANAFLQAFGDGYVGRALAEARLFAPKGVLMINEYGLEYDTEEHQARRRALLGLIERLRKEGAPLAGLGLQSHLDLRKGRVSQPALRAFLDAVMDLGLFVEVTELDVKEADYTAAPEARDAVVADEARRYLDVVLDARRVAGVSTWGLSDRRSWLEVTPEDRARFPDAWRDGSSPGVNRGLPLDASMRETPMYAAIVQSLDARRQFPAFAP